MSAIVKILIEGFTNADNIAESGDEKTQATVTLVQDKDINMVIDPGILNSQQDLVNKLAEENLTVNDINYVCITHSHLDHYRNAGMFPEAKVLEYFGLWQNNTVQDWKEQFSTNIQIVKTPGHDRTDITVFVNTGPDSEYPGIVAICGDVFWSEDHPADPSDDSYALDTIKLAKSRQQVLKMADWIIPGHGPIFKVKKGARILETTTNQAKKKKELSLAICRKCHKPMKVIEKCLCRPWRCYRCCECGQDCDFCVCSHKKK